MYQLESIVKSIKDCSPAVIIMEENSDMRLCYLFNVEKNFIVIQNVPRHDMEKWANSTGGMLINTIFDIKKEYFGLGDISIVSQRSLSNSCHVSITGRIRKMATIILKGNSLELLHQIELGLNDAIAVIKGLLQGNIEIIPGGGCSEMEISVQLSKKSDNILPLLRKSYCKFGEALEIIPRILAINAGIQGDNQIKLLSQLREDHHQGKSTIGIDGDSGRLIEPLNQGIMESLIVKQEIISAACRAACFLLKIDFIQINTD